MSITSSIWRLLSSGKIFEIRARPGKPLHCSGFEGGNLSPWQDVFSQALHLLIVRQTAQQLHSASQKEIPEMSHPEMNKNSCRTQWSFTSAIVPTLTALLLLLPVNQAFAHQYLNSSEPICSGSDPTVLLCDDFEDGNWYVTNADTSGGKTNPVNDGWAGHVFAPDDPQGYGRCGAKGGAGTNCTSTSGNRSGSKAEGWHDFGPAQSHYNEIYHRFYTKFLPGYKFGHEKLTYYVDGDSGQGQCCLLFTPFGSPKFDVQTQTPDARYAQNQGNDLSFVPGNWYYVEVHIKIDVPMGAGNGVIEVWADNCGTNGLGCTGAGTLRLSYSGINICCLGGPGYSLGTLWQMNWGAGTCSGVPCNTSVGEVYNDQVIVRTTRIGPMFVAGGAIQAPLNLKVQ